jgi:hypothetical protein
VKSCTFAPTCIPGRDLVLSWELHQQCNVLLHPNTGSDLL